LVALRRRGQRWMADCLLRVSGAWLYDVLLSLEGAGCVTRCGPYAQPRSAMLTRSIHSTGEALPVVRLRTRQALDVGQGRAALDQRKEVLATLLEAGGRVIDSSPMYGRAEAVVGQLLGEMQAHGKAFLATKVWTSGEAAGVQQMRASLAKLQAPSIDLMQI